MTTDEREHLLFANIALTTDPANSFDTAAELDRLAVTTIAHLLWPADGSSACAYCQSLRYTVESEGASGWSRIRSVDGRYIVRMVTPDQAKAMADALNELEKDYVAHAHP